MSVTKSSMFPSWWGVGLVRGLQLWPQIPCGGWLIPGESAASSFPFLGRLGPLLTLPCCLMQSHLSILWCVPFPLGLLQLIWICHLQWQLWMVFCVALQGYLLLLPAFQGCLDWSWRSVLGHGVGICVVGVIIQSYVSSAFLLVTYILSKVEDIRNQHPLYKQILTFPHCQNSPPHHQKK